MALTKVTSGVRTLGTGEVTSANLAAGVVDTTGLEDDIALLGFKVASNGSLAKYNLVDQTVDDFQDATGIDASASTNEVRDASNYYSGTVAGSPSGDGTETTYSGYTVHTFLSDGDFIVPGSANVDLLLVAGGGGGGGGNTSSNSGAGGAGGAGGFRALASTAVTAQTYAVVVGQGGAGGVGYANGSSGTNSSALGLSATGGGRGGKWNNPGVSGGSGGGGANTGNNGGAGNAGSYTPVEGYDGGDPISGGEYGGCGGGGASEAGFPNTSGGSPGNRGGPGGDGADNLYRTGVNVTYAGGGGGGSGNYGPGGGPGGAGGGGNGGSWNSSADDGTDGLGGGGGGGSYNSSVGLDGGDGGNGIVVIRWADGAFNSYENMTLVSNATTADAAPTKGDIVFTYANGAGTAVVGTDITAEYSADDGSNWTDFGLGTSDVQGTTGGHTIVAKHNVSLTSASGTAMRYRIKTLNQSVSKQTRIQAVSLGWS